MGYNDQQNKKPESKFIKCFKRKKKLVIVVAAIVLIIGGAVCGWLYYLNQKPTVAEQQAKQTKLINDTAEKVQKSVNNGKPADAIKAIDDAIKSTDDVTTISTLKLNKSTTYYNTGDYDKALSAALESETLDKNSNIEQYIAGIYVKKGDNQNAIKYYQNAIAIIDESSPMANSDIQDYKDRIDYLSGVKK